MPSTIASSTKKFPSSSPKFRPPRTSQSRSGSGWRRNLMPRGCIEYASTKLPISSSTSTAKKFTRMMSAGQSTKHDTQHHEHEKHEGASHSPLHVFRVAPLAQR